MIDNEFGVEYSYVTIRKLRVFRTGGKWLVEYQREPRWWALWDSFWWYNDGTYVDYTAALQRIKFLKVNGAVGFAQFQSVKEFEIE